MDGWDGMGWDGWILLRTLVQLEHLAVLIMIVIRWGGTVGRTIQSAQMKAKDGRILLMNEILQVKNPLKIIRTDPNLFR